MEQPTLPAGGQPDPAQRAQAMEFLQKIMQAKGGAPAYTPIMKALKQIGVEPIKEVIEMEGKDVECLIIPMDSLVKAEWKHMSELDEINEQLGG